MLCGGIDLMAAIVCCSWFVTSHTTAVIAFATLLSDVSLEMLCVFQYRHFSYCRLGPEVIYCLRELRHDYVSYRRLQTFHDHGCQAVPWHGLNDGKLLDP